MSSDATLHTLELAFARNALPDDEVNAAVERARAHRFRLFTLVEVLHETDPRERLYDLVREGVIDDPSGDGTFLPFEAFAEELYEPYYARWADSQILAAHGDTWVGLTNLQLRHANRAEFGITIVKRPYRRQGLARALKLVALRHARERGVQVVSTKNDPRNIGMLALNRSLGFRETDPRSGDAGI